MITREFPRTPRVKMSPKIRSVMKLSVPMPDKFFSGASKSMLPSGLSKSLLFWMFIFNVSYVDASS